jgi:hypothetical protein
MARRQGCVWAGRGAHVLGCVVPARRDSGGVFKASVVPNQVWGGGVNLRCVPATRGEGEVVSTYPAGLPK